MTTLADDRVHVAAGSTDIRHAASEVDFVRTLPPWRAAGYLASRALLRQLLSEVDDRAAHAPIASHPSGQPYLPDHPNLYVSLSHEGGWTAAAVGVGVEVGVDVQVPLPVSTGLLRRCCTPDTRDTLETWPAAARDTEFAWIWTVQEACVKAAGTGMAGRPWTIPVGVGQSDGQWGQYRWKALRDRFDVPVSCAFREVPCSR